jgi:hypothetical protein
METQPLVSNDALAFILRAQYRGVDYEVYFVERPTTRGDPEMARFGWFHCVAYARVKGSGALSEGHLMATYQVGDVFGVDTAHTRTHGLFNAKEGEHRNAAAHIASAISQICGSIDRAKDALKEA